MIGERRAAAQRRATASMARASHGAAPGNRGLERLEQLRSVISVRNPRLP